MPSKPVRRLYQPVTAGQLGLWYWTEAAFFDGGGRPVPQKLKVVGGTWGAGAAATSPTRVEVADLNRAFGTFYVTESSIHSLISLLEKIREGFGVGGRWTVPDA